jgi:hypothetical protein
MITKKEFVEYCRNNNLRYKFENIFPCESLLKSNWNNNNLFIVLCYHGYIETMKWLWTKGEINIHANNEEVFRCSCGCGCIELAKWLIEISKENGKIINISAINDFAFRYSCKRNDMKIAKWLCSLYDEYYIEIENNKIVKYGIKNMYDKFLEENKGIKK